jgi:hypothetical protein
MVVCCPTCGSTHCVAYDQPSSKLAGASVTPALFCRSCKRRAIGAEAVARWHIPADQVPAVPVPPPAPVVAPRPAPAAKAPVVPAPRPVAQAPAAAPAPAAPKLGAEKIVAAATSDEVCAWPGCGQPARAGSKYCSRACSNKNARARHAGRSKSSSRAA